MRGADTVLVQHGPASFLQVPFLMAWAPAYWYLKMITRHQMEETLLIFTQIYLLTTPTYGFWFYSQGACSSLSQKQVFSNLKLSLLCPRNLPFIPKSPAWARPWKALFTSQLWNHTPTIQQAKWSQLPPVIACSRESKGPCLGTHFIVVSQSPGSLSEKRLDTAEMRHALLIWRALFLFPPPEGWLHIIFYLHIYGFLLEVIWD